MQTYTSTILTETLMLTLTQPLIFDLMDNAYLGPAIDYMYTKFGVDSSSHFLSGVWTHNSTDRQMHSHRCH